MSWLPVGLLLVVLGWSLERLGQHLQHRERARRARRLALDRRHAKDLEVLAVAEQMRVDSALSDVTPRP